MLLRKLLPVVVLLAGALGCRDKGSTGDGKTLSAFGMSWAIAVQGNWQVVGDAVEGTGGWLMSKEDLGDATIEVDTELVSGQGGRTVGVGFRYQPMADPATSSGYGVNLTTGGSTYNVFKGTNGKWLPVNPAFTAFQPSPAVQPRKNHIVIRSSGASHTISVNGQTLSTFDDAAYPKGAINLWVESTADKVRFSNLRVIR